MTTPTAARPQSNGSSHWYDLDGNAQHTVPKKDGSGPRATTLADARKNNWVPSVTNILKLLHKEGLVRWMQEQVALAVLTSPRREGEADDAFVTRVLQEEQQHEQEARKAADIGTQIHDALEGYFAGEAVPEAMEPYVRPVLDQLLSYGEKASSEIILVGDDYAGTADLLQDCADWWRFWDYKSTKKLPDPKLGAWLEHRLQLAAYAKAWQNRLIRGGQGLKPILCGNIYISTTNPGEFVICEHENWEEAYDQAFAPLVKVWQYINRYRPNNPKRIEEDVTEQLEKAQKEIGILRSQLEQAKREPVMLAPTPEMESAVQQHLARHRAENAQIAEEIAPKPPPPPAPETRAAPKALPTQIGGKTVHWSTGTVAPSNNQTS